jgi:hypothetical protein
MLFRELSNTVVISSFAFTDVYAVGANSAQVQGGSFVLPTKYQKGFWRIKAVECFPAPFGAQPAVSYANIQIVDSLANNNCAMNISSSNASGSEYFTAAVGTIFNLDTVLNTLKYQVQISFCNPATVNTVIGVYSTLVLERVL